jgi:exopolyphosphatase/guanosine-5'-triphosphate,3'-diphosphate pyrophosphatase
LLIAAIDIGTNSIHMVIARSTGAASFEVVDREREVVQIGRGSFRHGRLRADAMRRTLEALARFVSLARRRQVDRIICTATAAVREARNGGAFVREARNSTGIVPRVVPSEEEGRLVYLGVKSALQLDVAPALILDIGGGSVQFVVGDRDRLSLALSVPLGALRLTQGMLSADRPGRGELQRLRRHLRREARAPLEAVAELGPVRVYGSSGTLHALAAAAHQAETGAPVTHLNGHVLTREALSRLTRRLVRMSRAERERVPGIDATRAEIIVPGALLLLHVLETLAAPGVTISDFGVREGLVTDYLASHAREVSTLERVDSLRLRSVLALLTKFFPESRHSQHVARLALRLFDETGDLHGLDGQAREWLHYAALLHDVGAAIGYDGHGAHSYYLIRNGNLRGLTADELAVVANVARYHGKPRPRRRDEGFGALSAGQRETVVWLAALLRIAEGLDRSHYQLVSDLRVKRRGDDLSIVVESHGDARLELWAARRRTELLERLAGGRVRIAQAEKPAAEPRRKAASGHRRAPRPD